MYWIVYSWSCKLLCFLLNSIWYCALVTAHSYSSLHLSSFLSLRFALASILALSLRFTLASILALSLCFALASILALSLCFALASILALSLCLALASVPASALASALASRLVFYPCFNPLSSLVFCPRSPLVFSLCLDLAFLVNLPVSGPRPLQGCRTRELFFGLAALSASRVRPDLRLA